MPIGQEYHQAIAVAVAIGLGCLNEILDLVGGQVLTGAEISVWWTRRRDCSNFSAWRDQAEVLPGPRARARSKLWRTSIGAG
jgi:hypothetical protein